MNAIRECYGVGVDQLADTAGDLDAYDADDWQRWYVAQWRRFADTFGFRSVVDPVIAGAIKSQGNLGSLQNVTHNALVQFINSRTPALDVEDKQIGTARAEAIAAWREQPKSLWKIEVDANLLAGDACVGSRRVFPSSNAPSYFANATTKEPTPRDACTWNAPLVLFLGTWPYYHGGNLSEEPSSFRWRSVSATAKPAEQASRAYTAAWTTFGNATTDARDVLAQYERYRASVAPLIVDIPGEPAGPGSLYLDEGGYLRAHLESVDGRAINGPLGPVSVRAHNHILASFAAFFALRRALLREPKKLSDALRSRFLANPDPCISKYVTPPKAAPGGLKGV